METGAGTFGNWTAYRRAFTKLGRDIKTRGAAQARIEAQRLVDKLKEGITSQAPGGKAFKELAELTKLWKGPKRNKILMDSGDLRNSITATETGWASYFVGLKRQTMHRRDGKTIGTANLGAIHEFGCVIGVTERMRRYFAARGAPLKKETVVIRIPARPFIRPVWEQEAPGVRRRLAEAVLKPITG